MKAAQLRPFKNIDELSKALKAKSKTSLSCSGKFPGLIQYFYFQQLFIHMILGYPCQPHGSRRSLASTSRRYHAKVKSLAFISHSNLKESADMTVTNGGSCTKKVNEYEGQCTRFAVGKRSVVCLVDYVWSGA